MNAALLHLLGWILIHSLWQFAAIGCVIAIVDFLLRQSSSIQRYNVLMASLWLMVCCPIVTVVINPTARESLAGPDSFLPPSTFTSPLQTSPSTATSTLIPPARSESPVDSVTKTVDAAKPNTTTAINSASSNTLWPSIFRQSSRPFIQRIDAYMGWIVSLWLAGVLFFASRLSVGWWRIRRLILESQIATDDRLLSILQSAACRLNVHRKLELVISSQLDTPVVVGLLRATVIIPNSFASGMAPDLMEAIFAHELAHVKRLDFLFNLFQTLLESLFFYHPCVWWLSRRIREERENCCDDMAASAIGSKVTMGRALLMLEEQRNLNLNPAIGVTGGSVSGRVRRLLAQPLVTGKSDTVFSLIAVALLVGVLMSVAGLLVSGTAPKAVAGELSDDAFMTSFDQNKSIQLVAIRPHGSKAGPTWRADGTLLTTTPTFPEVSTSPNPFHPGYDVLFQFQELKEYPHPKITAEGLDTAWNPDANGVAVVVLTPPAATQTAQITLGIPAKQWGPWQSIDQHGQLMERAPLPPSYEDVYETVKVHQVERLTDRVAILWQHELDSEPSFLFEVVAVLRDGQRISQSGKSLWNDASGVSRSREQFDVTVAELDHFEYRLCPIQYQVVFDNIALKPEQNTNVEMKVQRIPAATFDRSPALPQQLLAESRPVYSLQWDGDSAIDSVTYGEDAQGTYRPRIRRWDLDSGQHVREVPLQWESEWTRHTEQLRLTGDRQRVFGSLGDALGAWDANSGKLLHQMKPDWQDFGDLTLRLVRATASGDRVVCAGLSNSTAIIQDGLIYIWNGQTGQLIQEIRLPSTGYVQSLALSDDGARVAVWPAPGGVGIWDTRTGQEIRRYQNKNPTGSWPEKPMSPDVPDQVLGLQFSHDGKLLAIGDLVGIKLLDTETGSVIHSIRAPFRYNSPAFVFSPDDQLLLRYGTSWKNRHESLMWQVPTGQPVAMFPIEGSAAAFTRDGSRLAIGRSDKTQAIAVWQMAESELGSTSTTSEVAENLTAAMQEENPARTKQTTATKDEEIYWSPRSTEQWTTGIKVVQRPSLSRPELVVQYLLRNESDSERSADVSFSSGPQSLTVSADHRIESWGGAVGSRSDHEVFQVAANGVLADSRFQHRFDMTGLEPAEYTLRLGHCFALPTGQIGTRHGIPFDHQLQVTLKSASSKPESQTVPTLPKPFNKDETVDLSSIQWGDAVGGMRAGIAWSAESKSPLTHGQLASLELYVQNVSHQPIDCRMSLPHSMDGWGFSIQDSDDHHMPRKQTFFTGIDPRRDLLATLKPGEVVRMTGSPSQFQWQNQEQQAPADVKPLQFRIAENLPEDPEVVPPYTYGLASGNYSLLSYIRMGRADCPSATFSLTTSLDFQVE